ncbi:TPA: beta-lactamase family protein [Candidatus Woesearchaeota archaeon]|nr:beta-lactamase family protein [Candidatus Woesearchaeota archaeon]
MNIDDLFARWDRPDTPGCAVGVYRGGETAFARGYGCANLDLGTPITPETAFDTASLSKQFTGACIAMLAEEGRLSLRDDVRAYVPELHRYPRITVAQCLSHTSGLPDSFQVMTSRGIDESCHPSRAALFTGFLPSRLDFAPGTRWSYSNSGYFALARVVEELAGMSLPTFARKRIFEPLDMRDTLYDDGTTIVIPRKAVGYRRRGRSYKPYLLEHNIVGAGSVHSTITDLAKWDRNFIANRLSGNQHLIRRMCTPFHNANVKEGLERFGPGKYAYGLVVGHHKDEPFSWHSGSIVGYRCGMIRFPRKHLTVAVLANLIRDEIDAPGLAMRVAHQYLRD